MIKLRMRLDLSMVITMWLAILIANTIDFNNSSNHGASTTMAKLYLLRKSIDDMLEYYKISENDYFKFIDNSSVSIFKEVVGIKSRNYHLTLNTKGIIFSDMESFFDSWGTEYWHEIINDDGQIYDVLGSSGRDCEKGTRDDITIKIRSGTKECLKPAEDDIQYNEDIYSWKRIIWNKYRYIYLLAIIITGFLMGINFLRGRSGSGAP